MVDALHRARRWLKPPFGRIIDLRPADVVARVEVRLGSGEVVDVGGLVVDDERRARHAAADAALRTVIAQGAVVIHEPAEFPFYRYFDSAEELRDYIAIKWDHTRVDARTFRDTIALLGSHAGARLQLREQVAIRILRPAK